jgi:hypothetical protein
LNAHDSTVQIVDGFDLRVACRVYDQALAELEVRIGEESDLLTLGCDRRARNNGVVVSISQAIEDPIEIVASVLYLVPIQTEILADQPHEFDIKTSLLTIDSNL